LTRPNLRLGNARLIKHGQRLKIRLSPRRSKSRRTLADLPRRSRR
jgi:hypothetical protein